MTNERTPFQAAGAWIGTCFHTFVFAAYPVLVVLGANAGVLPLHGSVMARSLAVSAVITASLLFALRPLMPELATRAACLSFVFIGFNLYAAVGGTSMHAGLAVAYTLASVLVAILIVRPWVSRVRKSRPLNLAACAVLAINLYTFATAAADGEPWRPAADALIESVAASQASSIPGVRNDIYYVIVDGFGRPDILRDRYDLDLDPFVTALAARGFDVPTNGQSNYAQTFLSLGSSLNLSYLDTVASSMVESGDRRVLYYLIQNNALMKLAKRAGYRVVAIGSDYAATERLDGADHCHCEQFGLHEVEATALNLTPLRVLPLERWTYGAHRRKVEESFRHLRDAAREPGPKLVFAHVLAPHPPFVFGPGGNAVPNGARMFSFSDGRQFAGSPAEYVAGYRDQATFVANQVLAAIDEILARPGPSPAIVVHGDHGPGSTWAWKDLRDERGRERMGIFSAYRFPGDARPPVKADMSPVNGLRLLANRHLGTSLPPLPDVSFASTWKQPYRFEVVHPNAAVASAAR
jgi:hypothetical protein